MKVYYRTESMRGYRNAEAFVRGQKIRILIGLVMFAIVAVHSAITGAPIFK